jgi:hypothetical protein
LELKKTLKTIGGLNMEVTDGDLKRLDALQRRASILIQGFSFFMSLQQEIDFRNKLKEEYMKLLEEVLNEKA